MLMMFVLVSFIFSWLRREGILYRILDRAGKLLVDFVDVPCGVVIPPCMHFGFILCRDPRRGKEIHVVIGGFS